MVNLSITISITTPTGARRMEVSQVGQVLVAPILDGFALSFREGDLVIDAGKTKMTIRALNGQPVTAVELTLAGLDQRFAPHVLPPARK
jgi:hypothetical protein